MSNGLDEYEKSRFCRYFIAYMDEASYGCEDHRAGKIGFADRASAGVAYWARGWINK